MYSPIDGILHPGSTDTIVTVIGIALIIAVILFARSVIKRAKRMYRKNKKTLKTALAARYLGVPAAGGAITTGALADFNGYTSQAIQAVQSLGIG